jgi:hypothetical protein
LQTKELAFLGAQNELLFGRKKGKTNSKNGQKTTLLRPIAAEFVSRKALAARRMRGGYMSLDSELCWH